MGAGRKLQIHRRNQRWADKDYKKSHLGSEWKKPFAGASHAKGIVLEKMCVDRGRVLGAGRAEAPRQRLRPWRRAGKGGCSRGSRCARGRALPPLPCPLQLLP
jgi:hypothetical protein